MVSQIILVFTLNKKKGFFMSIDIQKAEKMIGNKFDLVLILAQRVREIPKPVELDRKYLKASTQAFEEVCSGTIGREYLRRVKHRIRRKSRVSNEL
jgi:DNA-directed RNA polymerase subunit K/omega